MSVLNNHEVKSALRLAWKESFPGTSNAIEQGGFILESENGVLFVERWPWGMQNEIEVPAHENGKRGDAIVIASFHTQPNPPPAYQQEPSLTDIRAVRSDPHLRHKEYVGEYVISRKAVYHILPDGTVQTTGETSDILGLN